MDTIYDDLDVEDDIEIKYKEAQHLNSELTLKISLLEDEITRLNSTVADMKKKQKQLESNISSLYNTAKAELSRKDRRIADLEARVDSMDYKGKHSRPERHDYSSRSSSPGLRDRRGKNSDGDKHYRDRSDNRRDCRDQGRNKDKDRKRDDRSRRKSSTRKSRSPPQKRTRLDHSRDKDKGTDKKTKGNDKSAQCVNFEELIGKPSKILEALNGRLEKRELSSSRSSRSSVKFKDDNDDKDIPHRRVTRNQSSIANLNKETMDSKKCDANKQGFVKVFDLKKQSDGKAKNDTQVTIGTEREIPHSDSAFVIFDTKIERNKGTTLPSGHMVGERLGNIEECFLFEKKLSDILEEVRKDATKLQSNENQKITQTNDHVTAPNTFENTEAAKKDGSKMEPTEPKKPVESLPPSIQATTLTSPTTEHIAIKEKQVPDKKKEAMHEEFVFKKGGSELILQALTFAGVLEKPVGNEDTFAPEPCTSAAESIVYSGVLPLNGPSETDKVTSKTLPETLPVSTINTSIVSTNIDKTISNFNVKNVTLESASCGVTPESTKEDSSNGINTANSTIHNLIDKENLQNNNEAASFDQIKSPRSESLEMQTSVICGISPGPLGRGKPRPKRRRGVVRMID